MLFDRFEKLVIAQNDPQWPDNVAFGVEGGGMVLPSFLSIDLPTSPPEGMVVFDSSLKTLRFFDGDQWQTVSGGSSSDTGPIVQIKSWYKNDIDITQICQQNIPIFWNRFSDGSKTDGQLPSEGLLPFTFKGSKSGLKIDLCLTLGVEGEQNGYVYTFVEFSVDNGGIWNPFEYTYPFFQVYKKAALGWDLQGASMMNMTTQNWTLTRTNLDVQPNHEWLFRVSVFSDFQIIINSTTQTDVSKGATALSSFTLTEIRS